MYFPHFCHLWFIECKLRKLSCSFIIIYWKHQVLSQLPLSVLHSFPSHFKKDILQEKYVLWNLKANRFVFEISFSAFSWYDLALNDTVSNLIHYIFAHGLFQSNWQKHSQSQPKVSVWLHLVCKKNFFFFFANLDDITVVLSKIKVIVIHFH